MRWQQSCNLWPRPTDHDHRGASVSRRRPHYRTGEERRNQRVIFLRTPKPASPCRCFATILRAVGSTRVDLHVVRGKYETTKCDLVEHFLRDFFVCGYTVRPASADTKRYCTKQSRRR